MLLLVVIEVTPQKKIVWHLKQNDLPNITLSWMKQVIELPNGHYLIGNCHAGKDNPQIIEVDKNKKVHWTYKNFKTFGNSLASFALVP
jgi:hypothetical protein